MLPERLEGFMPKTPPCLAGWSLEGHVPCEVISSLMERRNCKPPSCGKLCSMRIFCSHRGHWCGMSVSRPSHKPSVLAELAHNYHSEVFTTPPFSPLNEGSTSALALQIKKSVLLNALSFKVPLAGDNWIGTLTLDVQWQ